MVNRSVWFQNETTASRQPLTLGSEAFRDDKMFRFYLMAQVSEYTRTRVNEYTCK